MEPTSEIHTSHSFIETLQDYRLQIGLIGIGVFALFTIVLAVFISQQGKPVANNTDEFPLPNTSQPVSPIVSSTSSATNTPDAVSINIGFEIIEGKLYKVDKKTRTLISKPNENVGNFSLSPQRDYLAYTINVSASDATPTGLMLYSFATKTTAVVVPLKTKLSEYPYPDAIYNIGFSPRGTYLFYSLNAMNLYNLQTKTKTELVNDRDPFATAEWSQDEEFIVLYTRYEGYYLNGYIYQKSGNNYQETRLTKFFPNFNRDDGDIFNEYDILGFVNHRPILTLSNNNPDNSTRSAIIYNLDMVNNVPTKIGEHNSNKMDPKFYDNVSYGSYTQIEKRDDSNYIIVEQNRLANYHITDEWKLVMTGIKTLPTKPSSYVYVEAFGDKLKSKYVYVSQYRQSQDRTEGDYICEIDTARCLLLLSPSELKNQHVQSNTITHIGNNSYAVGLIDNNGKKLTKIANLNDFTVTNQ